MHDRCAYGVGADGTVEAVRAVLCSSRPEFVVVLVRASVLEISLALTNHHQDIPLLPTDFARFRALQGTALD